MKIMIISCSDLFTVFMSLANLLLEKLYTPHKCFKKGAILMAIRPLMIGAESRTNHFIQFKPSKG